MMYICQRCGKEFEAKRKTAVCSNCKVVKCIICGKEFSPSSPTTLTCSRVCRGIYVKQSGIAKERSQKAHETVKKNHPEGIILKPKICKYCGKEFIPNSTRQIYCKGPHFGPCPICGKPTRIREMHIGPAACSEECRQKAIQKTCIEKYGSTTAVNSEHAKQLYKQKMQAKFGVDKYQQTEEFKEKFRSTMMERYGVTSPMQSEEIKQRAKHTNEDRYGGPSSTCSADVKEKAKRSAEAHFGGFGMASPILSERIRKTNLQKYGYEIATQNPEIQKKIQDTCQERYGSKSWKQSKFGLDRSMLDPSKLQEFLSFREDPRQYIAEHYAEKPSVQILCKDLGVTDTPIYDILIRADARDVATFRRSTMELEVIEYLRSLCPSIRIRRNARTLLPNRLEVDIYLPDYNVGIECNPTYTHNSTVPSIWTGEILPRSYHMNKTNYAEDAGFFLFHIFGYEWTHRSEVIKSMLQSLLGLSSERIYARNTEVIELSSEECSRFLDTNHRQGGGLSASIRLGLVYQNELVSVMTFNKVRSTIGVNKKGRWELSRFCSKLHTQVVGGASKLFYYFRTAYDPESVVSYSDRAHTRGNLYSMLGFLKEAVSSYSYVWVNSCTDHHLNRVNCQKRFLPKLFNDPDLDIEHMTEAEIMSSHGYVMVCDSGTIRWVWQSSE